MSRVAYIRYLVKIRIHGQWVIPETEPFGELMVPDPIPFKDLADQALRRELPTYADRPEIDGISVALWDSRNVDGLPISLWEVECGNKKLATATKVKT